MGSKSQPPEWCCEGCYGTFSGEPAAVDKVPGAEGTVELRFCGDCAK